MNPAADESFRPLTEIDNIPYIDGMTDLSAAEKGDNHHAENVDAASSNGSGGILSMCGTWSFPWLLSLSMVKLAIYLNKLYQDCAAVGVYYGARDLNYCIVSAFCLFIPALIYILYMVSNHVKQQEEPESKEIGTRIVNGLLLVPWQIKGRVEVLHFSAQKVCQGRTLTTEEVREKCKLERQASVLEFFEEFYAGFIQLLLQLYIIIVTLDHNLDYKGIPGEIIASGLTLMSMMMAVRRKDDGILTGTLSVVGWLSMMISRSIAIAMATTVIHGWMAVVCILHGVFMSLWLSSISISSYQQSEPTSKFSFKRKLGTFFLMFTVFGLPSLTYWPIMFQLKNRKRPFIFFFIMLFENCMFFGAWYIKNDKDAWARHDYILVGVMVSGYVLGTLFLLMYICCKPKYTDQVVYHDMHVLNADSFGMYFEFCDIAFKLPQKQALGLKLEKVRQREEETHPP